MFNNDFEELKSRVSIMDLCQDLGIKLSRNHMAKCPFPDHHDKTPSFRVYPQTSSFCCFGCGKKGNIITFERLFYNLSTNLEAAKRLSDRYNLGLFKKSSENKKEVQDEISKLQGDRDIVDWLYGVWCEDARIDSVQVVKCLRLWKKDFPQGSEYYKIAKKYLPTIQSLREVLIFGTFEELYQNFEIINYYLYSKFYYFLNDY